MFKINSLFRRTKILEMIKFEEAYYRFVYPPLYKEFLRNFSLEFNHIFCITSTLQLQKKFYLKHKSGYIESNLSFEPKSRIAWDSFGDLLDIKKDKLPDKIQTLNNIDFNYDQNLMDYNASEYLLIGISNGTGNYFLGIGEGNFDKIYKFDFDYDRAPLLMANDIFEFIDNLVMVDNSSEGTFLEGHKYFYEKSYRSAIDEFKVHEIINSISQHQVYISYETTRLNIFKNIVYDFQENTSLVNNFTLQFEIELVNMILPNFEEGNYNLFDRCDIFLEWCKELQSVPYHFPVFKDKYLYIPNQISNFIMLFYIEGKEVRVCKFINIFDLRKDKI